MADLAVHDHRSRAFTMTDLGVHVGPKRAQGRGELVVEGNTVLASRNPPRRISDRPISGVEVEATWDTEHFSKRPWKEVFTEEVQSISWRVSFESGEPPALPSCG